MKGSLNQALEGETDETDACVCVCPLVWLSLYTTPIHHSSLSPLGQLITFSCSLAHIKKTSLFQTVWTDFIPPPPDSNISLCLYPLWTQGGLPRLSPGSVKLSSASAEVRPGYTRWRSGVTLATARMTSSLDV